MFPNRLTVNQAINSADEQLSLSAQILSNAVKLAFINANDSDEYDILEDLELEAIERDQDSKDLIAEREKFLKAYGKKQKNIKKSSTKTGKKEKHFRENRLGTECRLFKGVIDMVEKGLYEKICFQSE